MRTLFTVHRERILVYGMCVCMCVGVFVTTPLLPIRVVLHYNLHPQIPFGRKFCKHVSRETWTSVVCCCCCCGVCVRLLRLQRAAGCCCGECDLRGVLALPRLDAVGGRIHVVAARLVLQHLLVDELLPLLDGVLALVHTVVVRPGHRLRTQNRNQVSPFRSAPLTVHVYLQFDCWPRPDSSRTC